MSVPRDVRCRSPRIQSDPKTSLQLFYWEYNKLDGVVRRRERERERERREREREREKRERDLPFIIYKLMYIGYNRFPIGEGPCLIKDNRL